MKSRRSNQGDENLVHSEQEIKRKCLMKELKMKKLIEVRKLLKDENDMEP